MDGPRLSSARNLSASNFLAYLFQCDLELMYNAGKMIGKIVARLSVIKLTMYSLFQ